jgi:hypothetical protein
MDRMKREAGVICPSGKIQRLARVEEMLVMLLAGSTRNDQPARTFSRSVKGDDEAGPSVTSGMTLKQLERGARVQDL